MLDRQSGSKIFWLYDSKMICLCVQFESSLFVYHCLSIIFDSVELVLANPLPFITQTHFRFILWNYGDDDQSCIHLMCKYNIKIGFMKRVVAFIAFLLEWMSKSGNCEVNSYRESLLHVLFLTIAIKLSYAMPCVLCRLS